MVNQKKIFSFKIKRQAKTVFPNDVERTVKCAGPVSFFIYWYHKSRFSPTHVKKNKSMNITKPAQNAVNQKYSEVYVGIKIQFIFYVCIVSDKRHFFNQNVWIFFLFLQENICCGHSLEAPHRGASNEYPQHMFSCRNKKLFTWYLLLSGAMYMYDTWWQWWNYQMTCFLIYSFSCRGFISCLLPVL